jgi:hypothetical protein
MQLMFGKITLVGLVCMFMNSAALGSIVLSTGNTVVTIGGGNTFADVTFDIFASYDGVPDIPNGGNSNQVGAFGFQLNISGPGAVTNVNGALVTPANGVSTNWTGLNNAGVGAPVGSQLTFQGGGPVDLVDQPYNVTIGAGQNANTRIGSASFRATVGGTYNLAFNASAPLIFAAAGNGFIRSVDAIPPVQSQLVGIFSTPTVVVNFTAVPEPSTFVLLGIALSGVGVTSLRRKLLSRKNNQLTCLS